MIRSRQSLILVILILATALSWALGFFSGMLSNRIVTTLVFVITAGKIHLVMMEFMEIRSAPIILKLFCHGWLTITSATIITLYLIIPVGR